MNHSGEDLKLPLRMLAFVAWTLVGRELVGHRRFGLRANGTSGPLEPL